MVDVINTSNGLARLRRSVQSALGLIIKVTTFAAIALVGGLATSWYAIDRGTPINAKRYGPWVKWTQVGRPAADPYSRIRFSRRASLVYNADYVSRFEAIHDDQGRRLHSSCHYAIEGSAIDAPWWTMSVFDARGRLIYNSSNRHGFNKATLVSNMDGSFRIDVAREARPGNWIPSSRAGRILVLLELQNRSGQSDLLGDSTPPLPRIRRVAC